MSIRTVLSLAVLAGALGVALRLTIPVRPVDEPFRDVIRYYDAMERPAR